MDVRFRLAQNPDGTDHRPLHAWHRLLSKSRASFPHRTDEEEIKSLRAVNYGGGGRVLETGRSKASLYSPVCRNLRQSLYVLGNFDGPSDAARRGEDIDVALAAWQRAHVTRLDVGEHDLPSECLRSESQATKSSPEIAMGLPPRA
ncbi:hypothetical protein HPB51_020753 [Rhipicephalus microplus]|uniref:Uncharacterized protein n=1 Tax=Rhipicephalus microplus TaxID=6941 RepID=A0A9J6DPI5_RHIMP|nr:hypothetical protein HPB51_020753 [Rhipicephalus microplus]